MDCEAIGTRADCKYACQGLLPRCVAGKGTAPGGNTIDYNPSRRWDPQDAVTDPGAFALMQLNRELWGDRKSSWPAALFDKVVGMRGGWVDDGQIEMAQSWMGEPLFEVCEWDDDEANALQHPEMKGKLVAAWRFERR